MTGMAVSSLMQTFVSASASRIAYSLGDGALYPWIFSAYVLASTVSMPLFGKLGERIPSRILYTAGASLFGAGSLAAALAPSMPALIAARALSGIGAGAVVPAAYAIVGKAYAESEIGRVFSAMGTAQIAATVAGPLAGGLTSALGWRWGFAAATVLAAAAAPLVMMGVPAASKHAGPAPEIETGSAPDWIGAVLISFALLSLVLGLQMIRDGSTAPGIGLAVAALALSAAAYAWESRQADPILPLATLRAAGMPAKLANAALIGATGNAALAFVPLALSGGSPGGNHGFSLLPMMAAAGAGTIVAGFVPRKAAQALASISWAGAVASFGLLAAGAAYRGALPPALCAVPAGFGMGYLWPALLGRSQAGIASSRLAGLGGALQVSRNAGGSAGVALLGVLVTMGASSGSGLSLAFVLMGLCACAGLWTGRRAHRAKAR
jgi:MFS family permease